MENKEALETLKHQLACAKEEDCINDYCENCPHNVSDADFIEALTIVISAQEKQEQDRWIPVTERLPEENGTYLACYEDATVLLDWFNGKWFFYRTNPAIEETGTIFAWRPLPEPYKEEEV